jgi:predicted NBD/HSP70 family sugar kinase
MWIWEKLLRHNMVVSIIKVHRCIINSTNELYENQPLKDMFEKAFGLPAYIENESNLLAVAAALYDPKGSKTKDLIYLFIGEGLGTGIITNGSLVTGSKGLGGEISHIPIGCRGFKCYCGNEGCIETELTIEGFLKKYCGQEFQSCNNESQLWENFISQIESGDIRAMDVVEENGRLFGKLISILSNIFDPKIVYLGGITERIFEQLYPHMIEETRKRIGPIKFLISLFVTVRIMKV